MYGAANSDLANNFHCHPCVYLAKLGCIYKNLAQLQTHIKVRRNRSTGADVHRKLISGQFQTKINRDSAASISTICGNLNIYRISSLPY